MPRHAAKRPKDSPDLMSDSQPSRHNPEVGIMPQIVDTRAGVLVMRDTALLQQVPEGVVHGAVGQAAGTPAQEQWRVR